MQRKSENEIVSFNETADLSQLLEVEGADLDRVIGGLLALPNTCDTYKATGCAELTSCGTFSRNAESVER